MRPGMISDFVTLADCASQNVGMVCRVLADDEKRRLHVMRREEIEQLRRERRVWAVIERQGDIGPVDVNRIEGDLRAEPGEADGRAGGGGGIASFDGLRRRGALPENGLENQETDRGEREQLSGEHGIAICEANFPGVSSRGDMQFKPRGRHPFFFSRVKISYGEQRAAIVKENPPFHATNRISWQSSCSKREADYTSARAGVARH